MYNIVRKWLFSKDAEWSHDFTLKLLRNYANTPLAFAWRQQLPAKPVSVMGIEFPNPVGLAAGLDKNGECLKAFGQMGFGFVEIGTVTPLAQPGNPKPRMFRLPAAEALINRMGFNNKGVDYLVEQVKAADFKGVLGINIGKNKNTPEAEAINDYLICMRRVYEYASYITVNISSPNTPGLRDMQHGDALGALFEQLKALQVELAEQHGRYVPLAVKIAPDLSDAEIESMAQAIITHQIDAVIATNTTLQRDQVAGMQYGDEAGGLSGAVLHEQSTHVIKQLFQYLQNSVPIIAVGGINSVERAQEKLAAGASLVQVYTGFIYQGPKLIKQLVESL